MAISIKSVPILIRKGKENRWSYRRSRKKNIKVDETALPLNLSIYDLSGRLILNRQIKEVITTLNKQFGMDTGSLLYKIGSEKGNIMKKVIK